MLRLQHITKSFGATRAVDEVSLEVRAGEILALVGENGAGKTTLMRIAAGELAPDGGTVVRQGSVALVHQHFLLVDALTVAENLALIAPRFRFASRARLAREARALAAAAGIDVGDVSRRVGALSVGEKSKLELVKAIARKPATLILDEPTAVLTPQEAEELFRTMRRIVARGTALVFISHKLPEVMAVAERVIVMRGGRLVAASAAGETSAAELARAMVDVPPASPEKPPAPAAQKQPPALRVGGVEVGPGEIVAVIGVAGNGQSELAARLRDEHPDAGHIPEDRTQDGIVAEMSIAENLALRARRWNRGDAGRHAAQMISLYGVRAEGPWQRAGSLSGGNQQKVVLARELDRRPHLVVAAEPTRGLDIAAAAFVHGQLRAAAAAGAAVLLITSDLDEAFAIAGAIAVIYRGRLSERMTPEQARPRVGALMAGLA